MTTLPQTMRAAQWRSITGGIEKNLKTVADAELPNHAHNLPRDHTLVKVAYASVNHLDYKVAEMPLGSLLFHKPCTPGLDFSGIVTATNRSDLEIGQRVLGRAELPRGGALAEYVLVGKAGVAALSAGVSMRDAACVGICGVTALQCLSSVKPGQKVLVNGGSGGVGVFAIQVAKTLGSHVTAISSASNAEFCRNLGADEVVDYKAGDIVKTLKERNEEFDLILDTVFARPDLYWQSHHYLSSSGKYVCVGLPPQLKTFKTLAAIHLLPGFLGGGRRHFSFHSVTANPEHFTQVAKWIEEGKIKVVVDKEFDLDNAASAYENLKSGRTRGKLVVKVSGE